MISQYPIRYSDGKMIHSVPIYDLVKSARQIETVPPETWNSSALGDKISEVTRTSSDMRVQELNEQDEDKKSTLIRRTQKEWNKAFHHYLRWAVAEGKEGPPIGQVMEILGRDISLGRLREAAALANQSVMSQEVEGSHH
jgi:glutamyl-tRNA synthetase